MGIDRRDESAILQALENQAEWLRLSRKYSRDAVVSQKPEEYGARPLSLWPLEPLSVSVVRREILAAMISERSEVEMMEQLRGVRKLILCRADRREMEANFSLYQPVDDLVRRAIIAMWPDGDHGAVWPLLREAVSLCRDWLETGETISLRV